MDIPMSSVIVSEPSPTSGFTDVNLGQRFTGFGPLSDASKVSIKQRIRACEICTMITGYEVEKKYNIHGETGEVLYSAKEKSSCLCRFFCGSTRALEICVFDITGKNVFEMSRKFNCTGLCCNIFYPKCTQAVNVSAGGDQLGIIRERATWMYPVFHIFDSFNMPMLKIRGPFCYVGCFGQDVPFFVTRMDCGDHIATVTKKWGGMCKETLLDADNFNIEYLEGFGVTLQEKILILATTFLIDFMYYETDG